MKKILGLDIGTTSIGWAIVDASDEKKANEIKGKVPESDINNDRIGIHKDKDGNNAVGVRIISQDVSRFEQGKPLNDSKGSTLTPTAQRRKYRGARRMKSRYKLRRGKLTLLLDLLGMQPDKSYFTNEKGKRGENNDIGKAIYELRDKAIREPISLNEWGRIIMHLNQWRGYSSDRFAKEEKTTFDYYTAEITVLDLENKIAIYDDKNKDLLKYNRISITLKFSEPINIGDNENQNWISEISGFIFKQKFEHKVGDIITIKAPEWRQDKKGKTIISEYYKITDTTPDPTDWNYKYQTLQKTLTEWCNDGKTVGSYFYHNFYEHQNIERIRNNVVNRKWYEDEFDKIFDFQFECHKEELQKFNIDAIVKVAFKNVHVQNEVKNLQIEYRENGEKKKRPATFKEQLKNLIKDKIIYYQRPWQQAKNKGECPFEFVPDVKKEKDGSFVPNKHGKRAVDKNGKEIFLKGRTVIPRSHPLYQDYRMWQKINNLRIYLHTPIDKIDLFDNPEIFKEVIGKSVEETKELLYKSLQDCKSKAWKSFCATELSLGDYLFDNEEQAKTSKKPLLEYTDKETGEVFHCYFSVNFRKRKKDGTYTDLPLDGNKTKTSIRNILSSKDNTWFDEIHLNNITNLQMLWEIIYDITNSDALKVATIIKKHFNEFDDITCGRLANLKFDDQAMGNLSAKAIRQLLPLMSNGNNMSEKTRKRVESLISLNNSTDEQEKDTDEKLKCIKDFVSDKKARKRLSTFKSIEDFKYLNYWEAAAIVYGSHSSKHVQTQKEILPVKQHSMNNPVVERIVNETISLVNEIHKVYGFDEVRIELCRELKASMDEREQMWLGMQKNEKRNELAKRMLRELFNAETSQGNITKFKIYEDEAQRMSNEKYVEFKEKNEIIFDDDLESYKHENDIDDDFELTAYNDIFKLCNLKEPSKADIKRYRLWMEQKCQCPYTGEIIKLSEVFTAKYEVEHIIPKERYLDDSYSNKVITRKFVNLWKEEKGNRTAYEFIIGENGASRIDPIDNKKLTLLTLDSKTNEGSYKKLATELFHKGKKLTNLLRKEIPEDPIERELKDSQYINKKLKEKLSEIVGDNRVWTTTGSVTDTLRGYWNLNDVMSRLVKNRYENFSIPIGGKNTVKEKIWYQKNEVDKKTGELKLINVFPGFSKRLDHRHHALDAIIIACTQQNHIQYLNTLNAQATADIESDEGKKKKYREIQKRYEQTKKNLKAHITPWNNSQFHNDVFTTLDTLIISHKNTQLLITKSKNKKNKKEESSYTIRGAFHQETNYGKSKILSQKFFFKEDAEEYALGLNDKQRKKFLEKDNWRFSYADDFNKITKQHIKDFIYDFYKSFEFNEEKVMAHLSKHEVFLDNEKQKKLVYISIYKEIYSTKATIDLAKEEDIIDKRLLSIIQYRKSFIEASKKKYSEKDERRSLAISSKLFKNALYEVRVEIEKDRFEWKWLDKNFRVEWINQINYGIKNKNRTNTIIQLVNERLKQFNNDPKKAFDDIFTLDNLIKTDNKRPVEIKKVAVIPYFSEKIISIERKEHPLNTTLVVPGENYMLYAFERGILAEENITKRERAFSILNMRDASDLFLKGNGISIEELFPDEKVPDGFSRNELIFTLRKLDTVFINPSYNEQIKDAKGQVKNILKQVYTEDDIVNHIFSKQQSTKFSNKERLKIISQNLWQVIKFSDSGAGSVNFRQIYTAKEISIPLNEFYFNELKSEKVKEGIVKSLEEFEKDDKKKKRPELEENIIPYNKELFDNCIKVFTNKLGTKVIPYWEFPNGCWNKQRAKELGL